jgi:hypothetical protein
MMKNDPDITRLIDEITGGDGGFNTKPNPSKNGGVSLTLQLEPLIQGFLESRLVEINKAEGAERQRLIDGLPKAFRSVLKIKNSPGKESAEESILRIMHPIGGERFVAHAFDIENGLAFIEHGWADAYPGSGQPCHMLTGKIQAHDHRSWVAVDPELGETLIELYEGPEKPDGTRKRAREVLEISLQITIPPDKNGNE